MNCFHFTYNFLKGKGFNIPDKWNGYEYLKECKKIETNPKHYLDNKIHEEYFNSFTKICENAIKYDIIIHRLGIGVALNDKFFITLNHIGNVTTKPIRKPCKILRVI